MTSERSHPAAPNVHSAGDIRSPYEALRHCEQITRDRARNFYHGLRLLPEPKRSAMYALYAWMRAADDLVDGQDSAADAPVAGSDASEVIRQRLTAFGEATSRALAGGTPSGDPMWVAMAFAAHTFNLSEAPFHEMLAGQLDDLNHRRYETFDELRQYCFRVASTVGLLCIEVWGYGDPAAKQYAVDRGIAFQLTNILRDFREDYDDGRVYLPMEDFTRHALTPEELRRWSKPETCDAFITEQVERAASYYHRSQGLDDLVHPACRPTLWAMTTIYRKLLWKIGSRPDRLVSDQRVRLSGVSKAVIALRAKARTLLKPRINTDGHR